MVRRVILPTQEKLNSLFYYDPDGELYWLVDKNYNALKGQQVGYINNNGYLKVCIDNEDYLLHRIVWKIHYGLEPSQYIDHINRNKLDNRIENLREASNSFNVFNVDDSRYIGSSIYRGVYKHSKGDKWRACISIDKKRKHLGLFDNQEEASQAYEKERSLILEQNSLGNTGRT